MADGPYVLDQAQQQQGLAALQATGSGLSGGSTVSAGPGFNAGAYLSGFNSKPGTPGSRVYLGPNKGILNPGLAAGGVGMIGAFSGKNTDSYENARMAPINWDEKQKRDFISKGILYKMPGFDYNMGMPEIMDAWDGLVKSAQAFSKEGAEWSPGDVRALTTQMLTELLGRAPTDEELAKYRSSINGYERANPEMTTTTHTLNDMGEEVAQSSTTTGGASQAALGSIVEGGAKKGPEYGKYQAGTTYFNALMQMITGG